jgi:hypothetical protein
VRAVLYDSQNQEVDLNDETDFQGKITWSWYVSDVVSWEEREVTTKTKEEEETESDTTTTTDSSKTSTTTASNSTSTTSSDTTTTTDSSKDSTEEKKTEIVQVITEKLDAVTIKPYS